MFGCNQFHMCIGRANLSVPTSACKCPKVSQLSFAFCALAHTPWKSRALLGTCGHCGALVGTSGHITNIPFGKDEFCVQRTFGCILWNIFGLFPQPSRLRKHSSCHQRRFPVGRPYGVRFSFPRRGERSHSPGLRHWLSCDASAL